MDLVLTSDSKMESEILNGLLLVRTESHTLFCNIYGVVYDRVGFILDGKIILFWIIPTTNKYIVDTVNFIESLKGVKIFSCILRDKYPSYKYKKIIENLEFDTIPSMQSQYEEDVGYGLLVVNDILEELGAKIVDGKKFIIPYEIFDYQKMIIENKEETSVFCTDLLNYVIRDNKIKMHKQIKMQYKELSNILDKLVSLLNSETYIDVKNIEQLGINSSKKDRLIVLEYCGDIRKSVLNLRNVILEFIQADNYYNVNIIIEAINSLLELFKLPLIIDNDQEYISNIITIREKREEFITLENTSDSVIRIPLSGKGLEKLDRNGLIYLLQLLDNIVFDDLKINKLRSMITTKLYDK